MSCNGRIIRLSRLDEAIFFGAVLLLLGASSAAAQPYIYESGGWGRSHVDVVDARTTTHVARIPVHSFPYGIAISPDYQEVYVASSDANVVDVIDVATNQVVGTIPVGLSPNGIAFSPNGTRAYVANNTSISVVDTALRTVIATYGVVGALDLTSIIVSPDGSTLYATDFWRIQTVALDATTGAQRALLSSGQTGLALSPFGDRVYAATAYGTPLIAIDVNTNTVAESFSGGITENVAGIAVSPDGRYLFAAHSGTPRAVSTFDLQAGRIVNGSYVGGIYPQGVAVSSNGRCLFVSSNYYIDTFNIHELVTSPGPTTPFARGGDADANGPIVITGEPAYCGGDDSPPLTSASLSATPNASGWLGSSSAVNLSATDGDGGSGVARIEYSASGAQSISNTSVDGSSANVAINAEGVTELRYRAVDEAGNAEAEHVLTVRIDRSAPITACGSGDGNWHDANVTVTCTASDLGAGLADSAEALISLSTDVAAGAETSSASTGTAAVCDAVGNCATAGPVGNLKVDRRPPAIQIDAPTATTYVLGTAVPASFACYRWRRR